MVSPERGYVYHNRLTHSLKVGQIARRIAEKCIREYPATVWGDALPDPDAAEAAGLAHDLGHPPFGHVAEDELDTLVRKEGLDDGYEGNAQSFRIATRLAASDARDAEALPVRGLNLTRRTLDGILKYPWPHGANPGKPKKWGYYRTESEMFHWVRRQRKDHQRSLIAEIMDWADDITFAIHDLNDFYCAGRIPIDRCKNEASKELQRLADGMFNRRQDWLQEKSLYDDALRDIVSIFPFEADERYADSPTDRANLHAFSSGLIGYFVNAFSLQFERAEPIVSIESSARREVEVLKQFIWEYVIENPELAVTQNGQRTAIRTVFGELMGAVKQRKFHLLPGAYTQDLKDAASDELRIRIVADCVSGMTERELLDFYRRLSGFSGD